MEKVQRISIEEYGVPNAAEYSNLQFNKWDINRFRKNLKVNIVRQSDDKRELEFDMIGCTPALANAFRRALLSEVPSMAIEKVHILMNTSLLQDEVLAHRLGLLPLKADPSLFEYCTADERLDDEAEMNDRTTLKYELKVICSKNTKPIKDSRLPEDIYHHSRVKSNAVKWIPLHRQSEMYPNGEELFGMLEDDILIAKMVPGQEIDVILYAVKGIGKDHAKFSPVATASYRLMPAITLKRPIFGPEAELLKSCFSEGVIELVKNKKRGELEARVKDPRYDSCSRNVFRHESLKNSVKLERIADHYIFNVESIGAVEPGVLFLQAVKVLKDKCRTFLDELDSIN
ncbi:GSCOCG00000359001-RA-CDS [Cotesia congregata]|uniref:DNA-directed RNA polymerases I and III subunit RPAC1 n=1 Tax=Cotesia congregata TaxID=51543 RepID=A0A8J2HAN0_COTCN|nr:GSCOCG00000359001-RA-CDS [Cotesia congregata]CAG5088223.1 Similar to Polr1c: DNA-directed RNA polymerases I and III subunit RPAC1 (Mus musculus) [Cotesia congregata]